MLDQITQVAILVSDVRKATNFYSYVLGLPVVTKSERGAEFRTEGVILSLKPRDQRGGDRLGADHLPGPRSRRGLH